MNAPPGLVERAQRRQEAVCLPARALMKQLATITTWIHNFYRTGERKPLTQRYINRPRVQ
jgi:hypothetical protein